MKIEQDYNGVRLDRYLCSHLNLPHSLTARLLRKGKILLNEKRADINTRLITGDIIGLPLNLKITAKETKKGEGFVSPLALSEFKKNIIHEENDFLIINKPSGLATQGGSNLKISVDEILYHLNPEFRLVHRLDKETSGCLIVAKHRKAASDIALAFQNKQVNKIYIAITLGIPPALEGKIETSLLRVKNRNILTDAHENGKQSLTYYRLIEKHENYSKLELILETGRMHQIRAHLSSINCKIVGDDKYGDTTSPLALSIKPKMLLHALKLEYKGRVFGAALPSYFTMSG